MQHPTKREENKLYKKGITLIAGVDEAGRGAWAGPLVAAAVILPRDCRIKGINDSKKLLPQARESLYEQINNKAIAINVSILSSKEVDSIGLGPANQKALVQAIELLHVRPEFTLVDYQTIQIKKIPSKSIIKGDAKVFLIAAASIVAKVTRDRLMVSYHKKYSKYNFHNNKGYGTLMHRWSLQRYGLCSQHRLSFEPMKSMQ